MYVTHDQVEAMTMGDPCGNAQGFSTGGDAPTLYNTPSPLRAAFSFTAMNLSKSRSARCRHVWATSPMVGSGCRTGPPHPTRRCATTSAHHATCPPRTCRPGRATWPPRVNAPCLVELREALGSDLMVHFAMRGTKVAVEDLQGEDQNSIALSEAKAIGLFARFGPEPREDGER